MTTDGPDRPAADPKPDPEPDADPAFDANEADRWLAILENALKKRLGNDVILEALRHVGDAYALAGDDGEARVWKARAERAYVVAMAAEAINRRAKVNRRTPVNVLAAEPNSGPVTKQLLHSGAAVPSDRLRGERHGRR